MNARAMSRMVILAASIWCVSVQAGDAIWTDHFMRETDAGTTGLLHGTDKKVRPSKEEEVVQFSADDLCSLMVNHGDRERVGQQTFIGMQLIRFFLPSRPILDSVSVYRNAGWLAANGQKLTYLQSRSLFNSSLSDFQQMHSESIAKTSPPHPLLAKRSIEWHAKYLAGDPATYTASEEHIRFCGQDPLAIDAIRKVHLGRAEKPNILVENRLIRFQFTDGAEAGQAPRSDVGCPPSLLRTRQDLQAFLTSQIEIVNIPLMSIEGTRNG